VAESNHPRDGVVVREREGRHAEIGAPLREHTDIGGAVQKTERAMDVQVSEWHWNSAPDVARE
jgi:hypothetical protein